MEVTEAARVADVVVAVPDAVCNAATEISNAAIFALAVAKSVEEALSSTFVPRVDIWPDCTTVPKAPAVPMPRLIND